MITQQIDSKEVQDVRAAMWEGFRRLAKQLPDHHVLGVNLVRTRDNLTAAVFTVVRNGEPVQCVVFGDARGRLLARQDVPPSKALGHAALAAVAPAGEVARAQAAPGLAPFEGDASPDGMALGEPPVKQPVTPGLISVGGVLLASAFDVGEQIAADGKA